MRKQYVILLGFLAFAFLLFLLRGLPLFNGLYSGVQNVFSGPKSAIYKLKTGIVGGENSEMERLKKQNDSLSKKFADYTKTIRDNEALRSQFETVETSEYKLLPAEIIGFIGRLNEPSEFVIRVGKNNGVKRGMAVISGLDLVGKISQVSESYSRVVLLSNEAFTEVARTSENGSLGIVTGHRDFILLAQVSIKDKISENELVMTRGAGETIDSLVPAGLRIGKVTSIYKNASMPYQTARLSSSVNISKLETVFVVLGF